ncbi:hypothetical protein [Streptomyces sp. NPDC048419]
MSTASGDPLPALVVPLSPHGVAGASMVCLASNIFQPVCALPPGGE